MWYILAIPLLSSDYLKKTSIKINMSTDEVNSRNEIGHWANDEIGVASCTKLALSESWTHGLIAQSVRASEQSSLVVGSNPAQVNFL